MPKIEIPEKLLCPITHEIFKEPVIAKDGHTYEKKAIQGWVNKEGTSPKTRERITNEFTVNWDKKDQLSRFLEKNKLCTAKQFLEAVKTGKASEIEKLNYSEGHLDFKDVKDKHGRTALHWAASQGAVDIVKLLLPQAKSGNGLEGLHWAAASAHVDATDKEGNSPLLIAAENGHNGVVELLLAAKANVEAKDWYSSTPLLIAAGRGHDGVVELLLAAKANVEATDSYGKTPLHWGAAENDHNGVVELLLAAKANVEATDSYGKTPLHWAAMSGHEGVAKALLEHGATGKAVDKKGKTPVQLAQEKGKAEIAKLIPAYAKKLKAEATQAPQKIVALEKIIQHQQEKINQLEEQVKKILAHLELNQANETKPAFAPRFFKT